MRNVASFVAVALLASCGVAEFTGFLSDWMGHAAAAIGHQPLLQLSLPGTHDTMTYDLAPVISDGANDLPPALAYILHNFRDFAGLAGFVRTQARTQVLNLTAQLDAGSRFVDFRIMYSAPPHTPSSNETAYRWFCLHMVQSVHPALMYLAQLKAWLVAHPTEAVVIHFSRHGSVCGNEYPDVTPAVMRAFWSEVEALIGDLLFDHGRRNVNETALSELVSSGQRLVAIVSNYGPMTGNSSLALPACHHIDNQLGDHVYNLPFSRNKFLGYWQGAAHRRDADARRNSLFLVSLAGAAPDAQMLNSFLLIGIVFKPSIS